MTIPTERLVHEALAKSGLLWVQSGVGGGPVWHAAADSIAYIVTGEGEQASPEHVGRCSVVARSKESRARLISFEADADAVSPDDEDWERATTALKAGRLNAPSGDVVARWANSATVLRLVPDLSTVVLRGELLPAPAATQQAPTTTDTGSDSDSGASPAKTPGPRATSNVAEADAGTSEPASTAKVSE